MSGALLGFLHGWRQHPAPGILLRDLAARHIENLKTLTDRDALLEHMPKDSVVAEVGVDGGDFSEQILQIAQPRKLVLIDPWPGGRYHEGLMDQVADRFRDEIAEGRVEIRRGRSVDVLPEFADGTFDWVYLDADHTYQSIRDELELSKAKVAGGGIIAGHDYAIGSWQQLARFGVIEAVNEFCHRESWEMIYRTTETRTNPSFAIRALASDE